MGAFKLTSKVKATIIFAIITYVTTTFGLDLDKQTETLINALVPVIVGYLWVESWDKFVPNQKILAAGISAVIVYVGFRFRFEISKTGRKLYQRRGTGLSRVDIPVGGFR